MLDRLAELVPPVGIPRRRAAALELAAELRKVPGPPTLAGGGCAAAAAAGRARDSSV